MGITTPKDPHYYSRTGPLQDNGLSTKEIALSQKKFLAHIFSFNTRI